MIARAFIVKISMLLRWSHTLNTATSSLLTENPLSPVTTCHVLERRLIFRSLSKMYHSVTRTLVISKESYPSDFNFSCSHDDVHCAPHLTGSLIITVVMGRHSKHPPLHYHRHHISPAFVGDYPCVVAFVVLKKARGEVWSLKCDALRSPMMLQNSYHSSALQLATSG